MSSKVAIRFEPTTVKRRSLCGSSHDRCRCASEPGREAQEAEDDVLDARAHVGLAARRASRTAPPPASRSTHRDVVRAEAPQRVLVGAQLAEVEPVAVDVVDVAELAGVGDLLQLARRPGGTRAGGRPSGSGPARSAAATHALGVGDRLRERLLDEAVLAGLEHADRRASACVGTGVAITTASSVRVGEQVVEVGR